METRGFIIGFLLFMVLVVLSTAVPGDKFRLIYFNDTYQRSERYELKVILNPFTCPPGSGSPWIGASLKTPADKMINLKGKAAKSSGDYTWKFDLPAGIKISDCRFTVALWCGHTCLDRVPGPVTKDPRKIKMRYIELGKDLSKF